MKFLLDTNIIMVFVRDKIWRGQIASEYEFLHPENDIMVSVVTLGEIRSIALRNKWGERRISNLESILNEAIIVDINVGSIIDAYAEIDAYSQGKLKGKPLYMTSRNMGKNDLWIAATAHVLDAKLITTDSDFDHLNDFFLDLIRIEK